MSIHELDQLMRAETIARRDGLRAIKGTNGKWCVLNRTATKANGYPTYHVLHVVDERIIACDCQAAKLGRICAHRACVRQAIVEERYAAEQPVAYDTDPSETAAAWA